MTWSSSVITDAKEFGIYQTLMDQRDHSNTDRWLWQQGIDPKRLADLTHCDDLQVLRGIRGLWCCVTPEDQTVWWALWYRAYRLDKALTPSQAQRCRNMLKRAQRKSKRK